MPKRKKDAPALGTGARKDELDESNLKSTPKPRLRKAPDDAETSGGADERSKAMLQKNSTPAEYKARGWKPIPIPAGKKGPQDLDWETRTYDPDRDFNGQNIGVQLGPVSNGLTDIDLDCAEAVALAKDFLPPTDAVFGRKSKPLAHYLYNIDDPEPKAVIKFVDDKKETIVELRMGGGDKGAQTVFPGSIHPEGEKIEWARNGEPAKSTCAVLKDAVVKIAVATLLARHWPAKSRHDAALRCGGFLARAGWEPEVIEKFMRAVQRVARVKDHEHIENGCKAAFDAATDYREDGKGYGLPAIREFFGDEIGQRLAKFLEYHEVDKDATLERMNEQYCIMPFGGKVRVLAFEREFNRLVMQFYSAADFKLLHDNKKIMEGEKAIGQGTWWIQQTLRRQYEGLVFVPGAARVIDGRLLNLWQGWGIEPRQGDWRLLSKHILEVLAAGDQEHAEYIKKWTAWTFQHPDERAETALVFRGMSGAGKGLWGRLMCQAFGQHGIHISSHRQLTGNFNKHLMDCAVLFADEAFWPGDKSAEGTLKRIVTEPTLMIEPKFFDATMNVNRLHMIMASNATWVVPASIDDRRFAVFDVSPQYMGSKEYFAPLYAEMKQGGVAAMMYDLLAMDLADWHPRYDVPKTTALHDQKLLSLPPDEQWWFQLLKNGALPQLDIENPRRAYSRVLMDEARRTVPGLRHHSDHLLGRILRKHGCMQCQIKGAAAWHFPDLNEARAEWDKRLPGTEWDPRDEWGYDTQF
jgi:hypothetical protein